MKKILIGLAAILVLIGLYVGAIFAGFNLPKPAFLDKSIVGDTELKVTLLMDNNVRNPLDRVEVDLGPKPGPPAKGGVATTDQQGVATFMVKPGDYYIYFNDLTFPKNLSVPQPVAVTVIEGQLNQKTILVTTNSK